MRKTVIISLLLLLLVVNNNYAGSASLFEFDQNQVYNELADLSQLEAYVNQHEGSTLTALIAEKNFLVAGKLSNLLQSCYLEGDNIKFPFCWGCFFGPVGWLVVVIVTNRQKTPSMKAFKGCVIGSVVYTVIGYGGRTWWGWY
jgi:hypothetical protein